MKHSIKSAKKEARLKPRFSRDSLKVLLPTDIKTLLVLRDFRKLFSGQLVSGLGDWLATFAFISLVYALTGKATNVAFILVLRLVPPMFAGPIGGVVADRFPRRAIMVSADIARAVMIALVPFVNIWLVYVIAFVHEFITLFFLPARDASIPQFVPKRVLELANGLILASSYGTLPIAGALFGLLQNLPAIFPHFLPFSHRLNTTPGTLAFFADALTFVWSAFFIANMKFRVDRARIQAHRQVSFFKDFVSGIKAVWRNKIIRGLAYGITVSMFGGGVLFAVGIGYVRQTLHASNTDFGWLTSLWGAGMALGLLGVRQLVYYRGRARIFSSAIAVIGGIIISMAIVPIPVVAFALAVPFGFMFASALVLAMTIAQESAEEANRGAVMGGVESLFSIGLGTGAITIGAVASSLGHIRIIGYTLDGNQFGMLLSGVFIIAGATAVVKTMRQL